ncbi:MAG TPA: hypothetical protein VF678_09675 [bacterium]
MNPLYAMCPMGRGMAVVAALGMLAAFAPLAHAQQSASPSSSMEGTAQTIESDPEQPWYRGWRANVGLFLRYHALDVTQKGTGRSASILANHTYGLFPFASTPEWTFYKHNGQTVGGAVFFGAGQFTVDQQKVRRPDSGSSSSSCDTCDADDYRNLGTSISGSYQFITPALVYTLGGGQGVGAFRIAGGIGYARGDATGDIYLTKKGTVSLDSGGRITGSPTRARFSESSSTYTNPSYLIMIEFVFPKGFGISASSDFMYIEGRHYRLTLEEFRGGVTYELKF